MGSRGTNSGVEGKRGQGCVERGEMHWRGFTEETGYVTNIKLF